MKPIYWELCHGRKYACILIHIHNTNGTDSYSQSKICFLLVWKNVWLVSLVLSTSLNLGQKAVHIDITLNQSLPAKDLDTFETP